MENQLIYSDDEDLSGDSGEKLRSDPKSNTDFSVVFQTKAKFLIWDLLQLFEY